MEISRGTAQDIAKAAGKANPANEPVKRLTDVTRVPMDLPTLKLGVPEVPGFYLYWHLGKNVGRALRAGYVHVVEGEVEIEQAGIATGRSVSGNSDLGTNISVSAGNSGDTEDRLYLMKLPNELHEQDMMAKEAVNEEIAIALRAGTLGSEGDPDRNKRYMKEGQHLFYPKKARR